MITRQKAKEIADEIRFTINGIAAKHGVEVRKANMKWDDCGLDMTLSFRVMNNAGVPQEWVDGFNDFQLSIPKDRLGTTFNINGTVYTLVGYNCKNNKLKFIATANGKIYKMRGVDVKQAMGLRA